MKKLLILMVSLILLTSFASAYLIIGEAVQKDIDGGGSDGSSPIKAYPGEGGSPITAISEDSISGGGSDGTMNAFPEGVGDDIPDGHVYFGEGGNQKVKDVPSGGFATGIYFDDEN